MEKKKKKNTSSETTKKLANNIIVKKKKKKGFTLLEFIIIVAILCVLIAGAALFGISYYKNESKRSYIDLAIDIINAAKKNVNLGNYEMFDSETTYYIDSTCIKTQNLPQTTYGDIKKAYVVVTYNGSFTYYWTSVSEKGYGISKIIKENNLNNDNVEKNVKEEDIVPNKGIDGRKKIAIIDQTTKCNGKTEATADILINGNTGEVIRE